MKALFKLIILIVLGTLLFVFRADVKTFYDKGVSYVTKSSQTIRDQVGVEVNNINKKGLTLKPVTAQKAIETPGALRVSTGLTSFDQVKLSIKGVIEETNRNRAENGALPPLKENLKLNASAQIKLNDMFNKQYFEHVSPSGVGVKDLVKDQSYEYIVIGENLALGNFKDSRSLLDAWMASPGHRANILNAHYTEIGVAVGSGVFEGHHVWMAVQHFGAPRSVCPIVDEVLHAKILLAEKDIEAMRADLDNRRKMIDSGEVYEGMTTNEQIDKYNALVAIYNQKIETLQTDRNNYNNQVIALNKCIMENAGN